MRPIGGWSARTHCKYDHEFTPENTRTDKRGFRICRQCVRTRALRYLATTNGKAKQRAAKLRRYDRQIMQRKLAREARTTIPVESIAYKSLGGGGSHGAG